MTMPTGSGCLVATVPEKAEVMAFLAGARELELGLVTEGVEGSPIYTYTYAAVPHAPHGHDLIDNRTENMHHRISCRVSLLFRPVVGVEGVDLMIPAPHVDDPSE